MGKHISVHINNDNTFKHEYKFNIFYDMSIVFIGYFKCEKLNKKHKLVGFWDKYNSRDSNLYEPILTDELKEKALSEAIKLLKVKTWSEYKNIKTYNYERNI